MHWVDMQWLWGYHVLPGSIRDMIHLCREAGVKGCVNFDGIGYEKLAAEDPEALAELRQAVDEGIVEPVGCSYGQPYGLFHGGESNIRQLIYGARAVRRLLGVWPKTFWEEEFYFFPQLPQMLKGCGFTGASLFFQWTWHTPEVPVEESPVIWWEGMDGSRILTATRNKLNLHQWPEDMDVLLKELASGQGRDALENLGRDAQATPLIQQWLELMPSPDWMCRSELILPKLKELLSDPRFEVTPVTLGEYLQARGLGVPPKVFKGVSPEKEKPITKRQGAYLPHWRREGATYAVTFRLADSIPIEIQAEYARERERLKLLHEQGQLQSEALKYEYMRLRSDKIESYLDSGKGSCILREPAIGQLVFDALTHFDGERYDLVAAVVMPNHVHVVVAPLPGYDLEGILHSWKSFTSHEIHKLKRSSGEVWQAESYDHLIRSSEDFGRQVRYVLENPRKAGLVDWPRLYVAEGAFGEGRDAPLNLGRDAQATVPVRNYSMDQVWHGLTLGKNGDQVRSRSRRLEWQLQGVESLHAVLGLYGRPYSHWDVYPVWEFEEAWRTLLWTQHHDIDECEGLCGYVAENEEGKIESVVRNLHWRAERARHGKTKSHRFNPQGWEVDGIPPFGFGPSHKKVSAEWEVDSQSQFAKYSCNRFSVVADLENACFTELQGPDGVNLLKEPFSLLPANAVALGVHVVEKVALIARASIDGESFVLRCTLSDTRGILINSSRQRKKKTRGGYEDATRLALNLDLENMKIDVDTPYGVVRVEGTSKGVRKYPHGDWMTSLQWFESVERGFTAGSFVAFRDEVSNRGLLVTQQASTQWFRRDDNLEMIAAAYDPWDEKNFHDEDDRFFTLLPVTSETNAECWRIANTRVNDLLHGPWPDSITSALSCATPNVVITAFYREAEDFAGKYVENYAGVGMGYPYIIRLVEFDGLATDVELTVVGPIASVFKTNLLGQIEGEVDHEFSHQDGKFSYEKICFKMRAHEITTLYLDIIPGRKQTRDLDAKREIWATVHRNA